jgi:hypothetical protein
MHRDEFRRGTHECVRHMVAVWRGEVERWRGWRARTEVPRSGPVGGCGPMARPTSGCGKGRRNRLPHHGTSNRCVEVGQALKRDYGAAVTWARRLRCQQSSVLSVQMGRSLP